LEVIFIVLFPGSLTLSSKNLTLRVVGREEQQEIDDGGVDVGMGWAVA
jgi:hypothetical protein